MTAHNDCAMPGTATSRSRVLVALIGAGVVAALAAFTLWPDGDNATAAARRLALHGDVEQACERLRERLDSAPNDDDARFLLAALLVESEPVLALQELVLIRRDFERVMDVDRLVRPIIERLERDGTAVEALKRLSARFPDNVVLLEMLTQVLIRSGQGREAIAHAERIVELVPDNAAALLLLADAYDSAGRRTYMIEPLKQVLQLSPDSYIAHANLAYAQRFANELDAAEANARWCLERQPEDVAVRMQLAKTLRDKGAHAEALDECRRVASIDPSDETRPLLEADLLLYQRDFDGALAVLKPFRSMAEMREEVQSLIDRILQLKKLPGDDGSGQSQRDESSQRSSIHFADVATELGVTFRHHSPNTEQRHLHLVMGGGVGWLDIDCDGWPDLLFGQGRSFDSERPLARDSLADSADVQPHDVLFQNVDGARFREITASTRLSNPEYSMGIACGDWNNDGFPDVFVSCFGPNRMFLNLGDGTFEDVTGSLPQNADLFSASATWGDLNGDGLLDLYVTNYLDIDPYDYKLCQVTHRGRDYTVGCHPHYQSALTDTVLTNQGDGVFQDVSLETGVAAGDGRQGLGVVCADLDRDGDVEYYVANDTVDNQLWVNEAGLFSDRAVVAGVAMNRYGEREAGMGVAVGDVTGNGLLDLFVTHFFFETNTLYANQGDLFFLDVTDESGLGPASRMRLGFGATLLDADNDGWLDLMVANGHIHTRLHELGRKEPFAQRALMFRNRGKGQFGDVSGRAGGYFQQAVVGRGTAASDFDRDGKPDIVVQHLDGDAGLLRNDSRTLGRSVRVRLVGTASPREPVGAVAVMAVHGRELVRACNGSASYLSCDDNWLHFAVPDTEGSVELTVHWPSGQIDVLKDVNVSRDLAIVEGTSMAIAVP